MVSQESEILRKIRLIESLKAELVTNVGLFLQAIVRNGGQSIAQALASVVISCYVLGRRLGIEFAVLDEAIFTKLSQNIEREHEAEKCFGDFSAFQRHLRQER